MLVLGIEASARVAGAALYADGVIVSEEMQNGPLTHSETLMSMVEHVLRQNDVKPSALSAIALTVGPGSFTGLRIGAATAKGLALPWNTPVAPVSTLLSVAANMGPTNRLVIPMMDARRHQVYGACYRYEEGRWRTVVSPAACAPEELARRIGPAEEGCILAGDGAALYEETMRSVLGGGVVLAPPHLRFARPGVTAVLGAAMAERGETVSGRELELVYLRKPQAEREREERLQRIAAGNAEQNDASAGGSV